MRTPGIIHADDISRYSPQTHVGLKWVAARPLAPSGLFQRFKCAWLVFTGRADALVWHGQ